ncbi:MAG: hypothetical protein JNK98_04230 [Chitinophagaceae bacterium]|nr:hypothetical protein [Chitinophagaceae bacterium]
MWLVTIAFWLQAFAAPVILFGLIGLAISNETVFYVLLGIGILARIIMAEYIRRKIGLDTFFARIYGPNEMDKKVGKKTK